MRSVLVLVLASVLALAAVGTCKSVTVWMCLERCGGNSTTIAQNLEQIADNLDVIDTVAFETYNLGPNSTLIFNSNLTDVNSALEALGVARYAMISSYPYPPQFLDWMLELFADPQPFTDACVEAALSRNLTGFNVDFEPTVSGTPQQALMYAMWLDQFATELMVRANATVTVDAATWNPLWNLTLISATNVKSVDTMSTYTSNFPIFEQEFQYAIQTIPADKLTIGLETTTVAPANLTERFNLIAQANIQAIAIWVMPIPSTWFPFLQAFVATP